MSPDNALTVHLLQVGPSSSPAPGLEGEPDQEKEDELELGDMSSETPAGGRPEAAAAAVA